MKDLIVAYFEEHKKSGVYIDGVILNDIARALGELNLDPDIIDFINESDRRYRKSLNRRLELIEKAESDRKEAILSKEAIEVERIAKEGALAEAEEARALAESHAKESEKALEIANQKLETELKKKKAEISNKIIIALAVFLPFLFGTEVLIFLLERNDESMTHLNNSITYLISQIIAFLGTFIAVKYTGGDSRTN